MPDLPCEWRRSIADNWRRMLPHMRRGVGSPSAAPRSGKGSRSRLKLEEEIALRLEGFCKADAAIQAAVVRTRTEYDGPIESTATPRTSTEWVEAIMREASAQEQTIAATQSTSREEGMTSSRMLILQPLTAEQK